MKTPCEESGFHYCANCGKDLPNEIETKAHIESLRRLNAGLAIEVGRLQSELADHAERHQWEGCPACWEIASRYADSEVARLTAESNAQQLQMLLEACRKMYQEEYERRNR